jgi:hypothetical protein
MSGTDDRPQPRVRPRPAPTSGDPARPPVPPAAPAPAAVPTEALPSVRGRRAQPLVQLNTRVLPLLDDLVALIGDRRGMSKRDVVETALRTAYPSEYAELVAREQARERAS